MGSGGGDSTVALTGGRGGGEQLLIGNLWFARTHWKKSWNVGFACTSYGIQVWPGKVIESGFVQDFSLKFH